MQAFSQCAMPVSTAFAFDSPVSSLFKVYQAEANGFAMPCVVRNDAFALNEANYLISEHATYILRSKCVLTIHARYNDRQERNGAE